MNDIYCIYVDGKARGLDYNPMYKFNNIEDFITRVKFNDNVPAPDEVVKEVWRMDNLIIRDMSFKDAAEQIRKCFSPEDDDKWDVEF